MLPNQQPLMMETVQERLRLGAAKANDELAWPQASIDLLREASVCRWSIPQTYGGWDWPLEKKLEGYADIGRSCLTTAFILSQREAVVRRLLVSHDHPRAAQWLARLAEGTAWASVGVAHLASSRQHLQPTVTISKHGAKWLLQGTIPWLTGAAASDLLVVGARDHVGQPYLVVIPKGTSGCAIQPPLDLLALRGSCTAEVHLRNVQLEDEWILERREERIGAGDGSGGLTTSCLALSLLRACVDGLYLEARDRPYLQGLHERFQQTYQRLWHELLRLGQQTDVAASATSRMRTRATEAALRASQTYLTVCKGAGFVRPHLAQRLATQALFFLVWSCPRPTADALLDCLSSDGVVP